MAKKIAVVDGANIAYEEKSQAGKPKVSNLVEVRRELEEQGYKVIIIVDASLRHEIDDPQQLESLLEDQVIRQAPAGTEADFFIIRTAEEQDGIIISNDSFKQYQGDHPWINERRVPLMIIKGVVELYEKREEG